MGEIYLSLAAFLFHIKDTGIKYQVHNEFLSLHYTTSKYYSCPIMPDTENYACGYIVLNLNDFQTLFNDTAGTVDLANNKIVDIFNYERPKKRGTDGRIGHCKLPDKLWGNIPTNIGHGNIINCKRSPLT